MSVVIENAMRIKFCGKVEPLMRAGCTVSIKVDELRYVIVFNDGIHASLFWSGIDKGGVVAKNIKHMEIKNL